MPTRAEFDALLSLPSKWITINDVKGRMFCKASDVVTQPNMGNLLKTEPIYVSDPNFNNGASMDLWTGIDVEAIQYMTKQEFTIAIQEYLENRHNYTGTLNIDTMLYSDETHQTLLVYGEDYSFGELPQFNENTMIFIPAAGYCKNTNLYHAGEIFYDTIGGILWSSELVNYDNTLSINQASTLCFSNVEITTYAEMEHYYGFSIRPVFK